MEMGFNDIAKECLLANGYDYNKPAEERFIGFDFIKASYCASQGRTKFYLKDLEEIIKRYQTQSESFNSSGSKPDSKK